jgi:hypothetical protein
VSLREEVSGKIRRRAARIRHLAYSLAASHLVDSARSACRIESVKAFYFLGAVSSTLETATIPVLALSPGPKGTLAEEDRLVPWPCRVEDLAREIEAALRAAKGREVPGGSRVQAEEVSS